MKLVVIADDLTGANATGVKLSKQGLKTATVVRGVAPPDGNSYEALCIDTDSRYEKEASARKRIREALSFADQKGKAQLYSKRIDSTLRGNLGFEIDEMLNYLNDGRTAIVVSAFPESGRVAIGDYMLVDGTALQETDVAKDPVAPLTSSKISTLIQKQTSRKITTIGLAEVLSGSDKLKQVLEQHMKTGSEIISIDAVTDEHIDFIAEAMAKTNQPFLSVDPGPLTAAYARFALHSQESQKRILATVGSITSLTGRQLQYFINKWELNPIYVSAEKLASFTSTWEEEVADITAAAKNHIKDENTILVTTYRPGQKRLDLKALAKKENASEEGLAKRITDGLAVISREILRQNPSIGGCYLSGGDVTASVCAASHAKGIQLKDEVLPLAAYGNFIGGYLDGLAVVTKGGMVGDEKAISDCVRYLTTKLSTNHENLPKKENVK